MCNETDKEKSLLETLADTVKAAAESIVHPTQGTPMQMPLNESGYELTHLHPVPKPERKRTAKRKKTASKPAKRAAAKKAKSAAGKKRAGRARKAVKKAGRKNAVKKVAKKKKARR